MYSYRVCGEAMAHGSVGRRRQRLLCHLNTAYEMSNMVAWVAIDRAKSSRMCYFLLGEYWCYKILILGTRARLCSLGRRTARCSMPGSISCYLNVGLWTVVIPSGSDHATSSRYRNRSRSAQTIIGLKVEGPAVTFDFERVNVNTSTWSTLA